MGTHDGINRFISWASKNLQRLDEEISISWIVKLIPSFSVANVADVGAARIWHVCIIRTHRVRLLCYCVG